VTAYSESDDFWVDCTGSSSHRSCVPARAGHDCSLVLLLRLFVRYLAGNVFLLRNMWHSSMAKQELTVQG